MNGEKAFVDTNVFIYAVDRHAPAKQRRAQTVLEGIGPSSIVLSTQVLQEFYVTATRKLAEPLSAEETERRVSELSALDVVLIEVPLIRGAITLSREHSIAFWDALVVESARARGCRRLLTEDLQDGREFGALRVENPFAGLDAGLGSSGR